jgi:hypothetical protein
VTDSTDGSRQGVAVVAETGVIAIGLGVLMGLLWWWVTPTEQWTVVEGGLVPADPGFDAWFAADGWFAVLGVVAGVLLAIIGWRRGHRNAVAQVAGVIVGGGLVAVTAWALGGALGPPDAQTTAQTAEVGSTVEGALGIRAFGVLFAPVLAALTVTALLLARTTVDNEVLDAGPLVHDGPVDDGPVDDGWVPQRPGMPNPS